MRVMRTAVARPCYYGTGALQAWASFAGVSGLPRRKLHRLTLSCSACVGSARRSSDVSINFLPISDFFLALHVSFNSVSREIGAIQHPVSYAMRNPVLFDFSKLPQRGRRICRYVGIAGAVVGLAGLAAAAVLIGLDLATPESTHVSEIKMAARAAVGGFMLAAVGLTISS